MIPEACWIKAGDEEPRCWEEGNVWFSTTPSNTPWRSLLAKMCYEVGPSLDYKRFMVERIKPIFKGRETVNHSNPIKEVDTHSKPLAKDSKEKWCWGSFKKSRFSLLLAKHGQKQLVFLAPGWPGLGWQVIVCKEGMTLLFFF